MALGSRSHREQRAESALCDAQACASTHAYAILELEMNANEKQPHTATEPTSDLLAKLETPDTELAQIDADLARLGADEKPPALAGLREA